MEYAEKQILNHLVVNAFNNMNQVSKKKFVKKKSIQKISGMHEWFL